MHFTLIVDDPDAPDPKAPQRTWVHWVIYNLPVSSSGFPEGSTPTGAQFGGNDWQRSTWGGPTGKHRYFHKLYALDRTLEFHKSPTKVQLEDAMRSHILAKTELVGLVWSHIRSLVSGSGET